MVHANAHIAPPKELWTRYNIAQLAANAGRPLPLFQESAAGRHKFGYVGWYRIVRWNVCKGGSAEVRAFVAKRRVSQADMPREYWAGVLGQDWARVQLDKVDDPAFGNPMVQKTAASSQ
ncbi:hypothetical protein PsYK624_114710 [Phanerochaete sordida]|uniref:Uncharacterized protein n=1 Tax=Phanerochaete sordida TaxID=48140 RepID=A0A9P3GI16_9APHY|nr:hypothetical protein PsYK624_114710 [Phanerochaete sordida]